MTLDPTLSKILAEFIWAADATQPPVTLRNWRAVTLKRTAVYVERLHLYGLNVESYEGRMSSEVVTFDVAKRVAKTLSGRLYILDGPAGHHPDASWTFHGWSRINQSYDIVDVTEDFEAAVARLGLAGEVS